MAGRRLQAEDLFGFRLAGDLQFSPDGSRVAFVVKSLNRETNQYEHRIWVAPAPRQPDGARVPAAQALVPGARPVTAGPKDTRPRWSPDGRYLAFLSERSGSRQVWLLPLDGGEAWQLTRIRGGVQDLAWSPDGRRLAVTVLVGERGLEPEGPEPEPADLYEKYTRDVKVIDRLWHKLDGEGFFDLRRHRQVAVVPVPEGEPWLVTGGPYPHGDPAWSPDGRYLVLTGKRWPDWDYRPDRDQLWLVRADRPPEGRPWPLIPLTDDRLGVKHPVWAPDGGSVVCLAWDPEEQGYDNVRLLQVPVPPAAQAAADGEGAAPDPAPPRYLAPNFDRPFENATITDMPAPGDARPVFSPDGRHVYTLASDGGTVHVHRVEVATGRVARVTPGDRVIHSFALAPDGERLAFVAATPVNPAEVCLGWIAPPGAGGGGAGAGGPAGGPGSDWPPDPPHLLAPAELEGYREQPLTTLNVGLLAELELTVPERFWFQAGPEEPRVDGWYLPPVGVAPGERHPAILEIHGGPMAQYGSGFMFEFHLLAAAGYGVIFTNPRGSLGYGVAFCRVIRADWGNKDYADVMAGLEEALRRHPEIDPERLGVAGGSYGGFMVNWIVGHTDRFKAAVTMRSVVNRMSAMGTSDLGFLRVRQFGGRLWWEDLEPYLHQSPLLWASRIRTPLLIEHQENDLRCPIEQAEQLYTALKLLGREVLFVRYPGESHGMSRTGKPWHRVHRLKTIVGWFDRYLKAGV